MRISDWSSDVCSSDLLHRAIEFLDQFGGRHAGAPLVSRLELNGRLEHLERRRIGCGFGATSLAKHAADLGHGFDEPIGLLEQRRCLGSRQARQGGGHVEQRSEEHTSELQSLMRISYAVFCLKKHKKTTQ